MKKGFGVLAVAACLTLGAVDDAKAAGPFMVTFPGFCDCVTIYTDIQGGQEWIYGTWDWTCAGAPPYAPVIGSTFGNQFGTHPTVPSDSGFSAWFDLVGGCPGSSTTDLAATFSGGAGDLLVFVDNTPVDCVPGTCPGAPVNAGMPRLLRFGDDK